MVELNSVAAVAAHRERAAVGGQPRWDELHVLVDGEVPGAVRKGVGVVGVRRHQPETRIIIINERTGIREASRACCRDKLAVQKW